MYKIKIAVYDSGTPMTLKQSEDRQTWYMVDHKQGYYHAKFERPPLNSVCRKTNVRFFVNSRNTSIISLGYVQK